MSVEEQFEKFYENIKLTPSQKEDAIIKYTGVCKKLHDCYYPTLEYDGTTKLLIGSYGKHTQIRPARDIDVIFIMPIEKFEQYNDNQSNKQSQLLNDIKCILEEKYPGTPIKAFGKVVVLEFAETRHNVELLPAWENEDGTFTIPNSENGGSWEHWDPRAGIKKIADSNTQTGKTRILIRMVKKWSENCTAKIKSFEIENKVIDFFGTQESVNGEYSSLVKDFFKYFFQTTSDTDLRSHLETALNRANRACEFENNDNLEKSVEEWQKIFGNDFPITLQKAIFVTDIKPPLADYSHCEPLRWNYIATYRVSIDAYIFDKTKINKLGGINSDGRTLTEGLNLKYIANTNTKEPFEYYWQVVNTGEHAKKVVGGLRGSIFSHGRIRWEHTQYPGKHWIECFVVQNGYCVARSGKFYINIK